MSKYIVIYYGQKKIGLSVTDDNKVFAFPLETVKNIAKKMPENSNFT